MNYVTALIANELKRMQNKAERQRSLIETLERDLSQAKDELGQTYMLINELEKAHG
jgi:hypothetical protein